LGGAAWAAEPPEPPDEGHEHEEEAVGEQRETEILEFIKTHQPHMHERLSHVKGERPQMYRQRMREISHMYENPEIRDQWVKQSRAQRRVHELTREYRRAKDPEKGSVKEKLRQALAELFDLNLAQKELHLRKMQEQIVQLKDKIAKRKADKDKLLKRRLDRMTGAEEDEDW
jgi:hypothetical protein